jgi:hypothetical protein
VTVSRCERKEGRTKGFLLLTRLRREEEALIGEVEDRTEDDDGEGLKHL